LLLDDRVLRRVPGALSQRDRDTITQRAGEVAISGEVTSLLARLRHHFEDRGIYVSDRRWTRIVWLLKVAAATEGRSELCLWDLWLLPWCTAHDVEGQSAVGDWLLTTLGVREAHTPPRLTRIVEAFEAQAALEQVAEDLDYDPAGRLTFATRLDERVPDAKGAAEVTRMSFTRRRRYGETHIGARVRQVDELTARIAGYVDELRARRADLAAYARQSLWLDPDFEGRVAANLEAVQAALADLARRVADARAAFFALPRLPSDPGTKPDPVLHEALEL
jgi:MoxR-like ATPase